jgi:hypothetical protein
MLRFSLLPDSFGFIRFEINQKIRKTPIFGVMQKQEGKGDPEEEIEL